MLRFVSSIVDTGIWPLLICFWGEALSQQVSPYDTVIACKHRLMNRSLTSTEQSLFEKIICQIDTKALEKISSASSGQKTNEHSKFFPKLWYQYDKAISHKP
jgi:hypothetical protein